MKTMTRRSFVAGIAAMGLASSGCRGFQYGHLVRPETQDMVGSHSAGAAVYKPLVDESVAKLLGRCESSPSAAVFNQDGIPHPQSVYFVGVENASAEELGDFKEHLYELIDTKIGASPAFAPFSRKVADVALRNTNLRPDSLIQADNMQLFTSYLQRDGQPVDYLLFAKITSGTTERNSSSQRDYLLTLEMIDTRNHQSIKELAEIRKGYHKSPWARISSYNIFSGNR